MRLLVLYLTPLMVVALGVPLWLHLIPPNQFYGMRTERTLSSQELWYLANDWTGLVFIIAGFAMLLVNIVIDYTMREAQTAVLVCVAVEGVIIALALAVSFFLSLRLQ